jgi:hypothetical protein
MVEASSTRDSTVVPPLVVFQRPPEPVPTYQKSFSVSDTLRHTRAFGAAHASRTDGAGLNAGQLGGTTDAASPATSSALKKQRQRQRSNSSYSIHQSNFAGAPQSGTFRVRALRST